jgi:hypothetical protein
MNIIEMKKPKNFAQQIADIQKMPYCASNLDALESQTHNIIKAIEELRDEQETKRNNLPINFTNAPGSGAILWARYEILDNSIYCLEDIDFVYDTTEPEWGNTEEDACNEIRESIKMIISYQHYFLPPDRAPNPNIGLG